MQLNDIFYIRRAKLKRIMNKGDSAYIILNPVNIYYFTGFYAEGVDRLIALILTGTKDILLVPELHKQEAGAIKNIDVVSWDDSVDPWNILKLQFARHYDSIGLEHNFPIFAYKMLFFDKNIELIDSEISQLRSIKDKTEIENIKKAIEISEKSLKQSLPDISENITERQFSHILDANMEENGASGLAFPTIVSFGENAANPHHMPDSTKLKKNQCVVIDFGSRYNMYCSDMTRTFVYGKPDDDFLNAYNTVKKAQKVGCENASSAINGRDLDGIVREVIAKSGYGKYFIHRTGHGIGLDEHENPYVDFKNTELYLPGNTITIEPGIYVPGKFGIRIEDIVLITDNKSINMNSLSHDLEVL
ncbi:Xaa-Pro peptidase family protein [Ferroplasma sp.]|uniref:M24 family metallopeptidase n=1 Tax=Ferroplasma sp. TaxID=2591003 RepID=UPI00307D610F